ncbi:CAS/CSE protein, partial [Infundibulicybe gibba]
MADLPSLLLGSLNPDSRKQAEQSLTALSTQQGFLTHLLRLVLEQTQDRSIRLSASVYLKNLAKLKWDEDVQPLPEQDKALLRSQLVPAMLALSNPADKAVRAQIAETVSLIAELDFPERWPDLIDQLVSSLSATEYNVNIGVLQTAHSIFRQWRAHVPLPPDIHLLLTSTPQNVDILAQAMFLLVEIFHDFTCQDLPPAIEDAHDEFFAPGRGWFQAFLAWDPESLRVDSDETTPSLTSQVKTAILEIAELYIKLYPDQLQKSPAVEALVQAYGALSAPTNSLASPTMRSYPNPSNSYPPPSAPVLSIHVLLHRNPLLSRPGRRRPQCVPARARHRAIRGRAPRVYPLRSRLSTTGTDVATRRQAAADVLQALVGSGYEKETTEIVGQWISKGLEAYASDKQGKWREKDGAVYLLTAVATRGSTSQHGVTSTNTLIDVVKFFSDHVFQDLQAEQGHVHPILQVDAIRFLCTFRNQLTKPQLLSVIPLLVRHLGSSNYVTYTYAAITIDRVLSIKQNNMLLFVQADIREFAPESINTLLTKVEGAGTPEKVAENDHIMKCVMRVIMTARQTLTPVYQTVLARLVAILGVVSKNPSNPRFDQFIFESLSGLMRFVVAGTPTTLPTFEQALFGPFTIILQQDIDQYIPYVFQMLAQMLELHTTSVPAEYRGLLPFLLTPAMWQQKGSIPGLVKLLKAFLARDSPQMHTSGQIASVLAVVQQRLIPSKINDAWGFELLCAVVMHVPPTDLRQYFKAVIMSLLTRIHTNKTDKFIYLFARFLLFSMAINVEGLTPDYTIGTIEEIQSQLWSQILNNFVVPQVAKLPHKDRKIGAIGLTRMLTKSQYMLREPSVQSWPPAFTALVKLFSEPQFLVAPKSSDDPHAGLTEIDYEEQTAGYQAAYSRLAASESAEADPVAYVQDPQQYLGQQLVELAKGGAPVKNLVSAADPAVGPFVQSLATAGYAF